MTPVREERKTPVIEEEKNLDYFMKKMRERVTAYHQQAVEVKPTPAPSVIQENVNYEALPASQVAAVKQPVPEQRTVAKEPMPEQAVAPREEKSVVTEKQLDFFEEKLLTKKSSTGNTRLSDSYLRLTGLWSFMNSFISLTNMQPMNACCMKRRFAA